MVSKKSPIGGAASPSLQSVLGVVSSNILILNPKPRGAEGLRGRIRWQEQGKVQGKTRKDRTKKIKLEFKEIVKGLGTKTVLTETF